MRRSLFLLELRRALIPALTLAIALAVIVTIVEKGLVMRRGENPQTAWGAVQVVLLCAIGFSGVLAGARVFSNEFKAAHYPLLSVLPLPSRSAWAMLLLAGASASAISIAAIPLIRPALVADARSANLFLLAVLGHFCGFAAGALMALVVPRGLFAVVTGLPLAAWVLFETITLDDERGPGVTLLGSPGAIAGVALFLTLGWAIYTRGEFDLARSRIRNAVAVALGTLLVVLSFRMVYPSSMFASSPLRLFPSSLSRDGRFVARPIRGRARQWEIRVNSVETGRVVGEWAAPGVNGYAWAPDDDEIFVLADEEPLFRVAGFWSDKHGALYRVAPDGSLRSRVRFEHERLVDAEILENHRALVLLTDDLSSRVAVIDAAGHAATLASGLPPGGGNISEWSPGHIVVIVGRPPIGKSLLYVGGKLEPLDSVTPEAGAEEDFPRVIGRRIFRTTKQVQVELERLYPRPASSPPGTFVASYVLPSESTVFYLPKEAEDAVWIEYWDRSGKTWREVVRGALDDRPMTMFDIDPDNGIALFQRRLETGIGLFLFDAALGRTVLVDQGKSSFDLFPARTRGSNFVLFAARSAEDRHTMAFRYVLGSGAPSRLPPRQAEELIEAIPFANLP